MLALDCTGIASMKNQPHYFELIVFKIKNVLIMASKVAVFLLIILNILGKIFYETSKTVWTTSCTKSYIRFRC